jgi:cobalamin biosynthesis Mg chelatase CobN
MRLLTGYEIGRRRDRSAIEDGGLVRVNRLAQMKKTHPLRNLASSSPIRGGTAPDTVVSLQRCPDKIEVESLSQTVGRELRTRYLNPKWIDGMKKEDYAGAREMSYFVEYLYGWQVTVPFAVDETKWPQTFEVYVEDKYGLQLKEFFDKANPWA